MEVNTLIAHAGIEKKMWLRDRNVEFKQFQFEILCSASAMR